MKIVALALILMLVGCNQNTIKPQQIVYVLTDNTAPIQVITIDSCEYLYSPREDRTFLTHKGNCNNPAHNSLFVILPKK